VPLHAIIFDFDGVLVNSEPLHLRTYQEIFAGHGRTLTAEEYYARFLGCDDETLMRMIDAEQGWDLGEDGRRNLIARKSERFKALAASAPELLFPAVADRVREFAGAVPLAIASGALAEEVEEILVGTGLRPFFRVVVGSGDGLPGKPAPDLYLRALAELGEQAAIPKGPETAAGCVAIEDSSRGLAAARAAGLRCVGIAQSYPAEHLMAADLVVNRVADLALDVLRRLCDD
jgi:beta-phosphoglucomutase